MARVSFAKVGSNGGNKSSNVRKNAKKKQPKRRFKAPTSLSDTDSSASSTTSSNLSYLPTAVTPSKPPSNITLRPPPKKTQTRLKTTSSPPPTHLLLLDLRLPPSPPFTLSARLTTYLRLTQSTLDTLHRKSYLPQTYVISGPSSSSKPFEGGEFLGPEIEGFRLPESEFGGEESCRYWESLVRKVSRVVLEEKRKGGKGGKKKKKNGGTKISLVIPDTHIITSPNYETHASAFTATCTSLLTSPDVSSLTIVLVLTEPPTSHTSRFVTALEPIPVEIVQATNLALLDYFKSWCLTVPSNVAKINIPGDEECELKVEVSPTVWDGVSTLPKTPDLTVVQAIDSNEIDVKALFGTPQQCTLPSNLPVAERQSTTTLLSQICLHLVSTSSGLLLRSRERNVKTKKYSSYVCLPESNCCGLILLPVSSSENLFSKNSETDIVDEMGDDADEVRDYVEKTLGALKRTRLNPYLIDEVGSEGRRQYDDNLLDDNMLDLDLDDDDNDDDVLSDHNKEYLEVVSEQVEQGLFAGEVIESDDNGEGDDVNDDDDDFGGMGRFVYD